MSSLTFDDLLARAWTRGVAAGDAPTLCAALRADTVHPRACEVRAFATLAVLLDDDDLGLIPEGDLVAADGDAAARVLGHAAAAWAAAALHDTDAALAALERVEATLGEVQALRPADPRQAAAEAWSDLIVARCAVLGGDRATAERRLRAIVRHRDAPAALRVAARLTLGLRVLSALDRPAEAVAVLERAARDAEALGEVAEVARARTFAGMYLLVLGKLPRAAAALNLVLRDERPAVPARFRMFARMLLAGTRGDEGALAELAAGIERAAADGDHLSYVVFVITSARLHRKLARPSEAVMLLSGAIAQLGAADASGQLAAPLVSERDAMREALGTAAYEAACREAVERLRAAHPR